MSCDISINGKKLTADDEDKIQEVIVEQSLHVPDMFLMRLVDVGEPGDPFDMKLLKTIDNNTFPVGAEVSVSMGSEGTPQSVFKGEITAVEVELSQADIPVMAVRGYARSHRLHRGRKSKTFQNMTDDQAVSQVAQAAGLSAVCDSTQTVRPYICQHNQTDWEFMKELAALHGFELFTDGKTLHFRKPQENQSTAPAQALSENLHSFRLTMSSANYADKVTVRAWDPKTKQAVVGETSTGRLAPSLGLGTMKSNLGKFGSTQVYVVDQPVAATTDATALAQAIYDGLEGSLIQAEGECEGDPGIAPGKTVQIKGVSTRLSGKYYITAATHRYDGRREYTTSFSVSGTQTNSLLELSDRRREAFDPPSAVVGVVTNNTDPDGLGRVKVKFPWLAENHESGWARIASPMAGASRGFFFLPEVDDEVLVTFEHGDMSRPYVIGALWNGKDLPAKKNSEVTGDGKVNERMIKTRAGHIISLDDKTDAEKISIIDKTGKNSIVIESKSNKITITADGDVSITAKGQAQITTQKDATITATGSAKITASKDVEVTASGKATVNASTSATVSAGTNLELKGQAVSVEAQSTLSLKSSGTVSIQGAMVNIN